METQESRMRGAILPFSICLLGKLEMEHQHCCRSHAQHSWARVGTGSRTPLHLCLDSSVSLLLLTGEDSGEPDLCLGKVQCCRPEEAGAVGFVLTIGCCTLLDLGFGCLQTRYISGHLSSVTSFSVYSLSEPSLQKNTLSL